MGLLITLLIVYLIGAIVWFVVNVIEWSDSRGESKKAHARYALFFIVWLFILLSWLVRDAFPKDKKVLDDSDESE
jgi:NADH:ubiquinone oxidoreductase subunit 6 (subunit J)